MFKKVAKIILWSALPIGLGVLFASFVWNGTEKIVLGDFTAPKISFIEKLKKISFDFKKDVSSVAPVFKFDNIVYPPRPVYAIKDENKSLNIGAVSYVVGDLNTGEIILEKNSDSVFPIASVTKLMTALVSLETLPQNEKTKVSSRAANIESSRGDLRTGESVVISDLLYPLLLVSSNNAAEVLAEHKGRPDFIKEMNDFAKKIGMEKTSFDDPSGLSSRNTSTAKDLFKLSTHLENNHRTVFDISMLREYTAIGKIWRNINTFSQNDNFIGGKTGYTSVAKRTGVSVFSVSFDGYEDRHIGIVLLRTDDRTKDIYTILNYLRENVAYAYPEELRQDKSSLALSESGIVETSSSESGGEVAGVETINEVIEILREPIRQNSCEKPNGLFNDMLLFNASAQNRLPENYIPNDLIPIKDLVDTKGRDICLREIAAFALEDMFKAAKEDKVNLVVTSAFRSEETQKWIYDDWHRRNTIQNGEEAVAKPGHSEHQLGTTIDFTSPSVGFDSAHRSFNLTKEYAWLDKNAHKFGFSMSYPAGKNTGYIFEPWHWRYIGIPDAYHLKVANITIQEFLDPTLDIKDILPKEVTISFLGDIMMDRGVKTSVYNNYGGDYNSLFKNLGEIKESDIVFANLEGPVSDKGNNVGSKYSFRMEPKSLDALVAAGFNMISFANNHVGDWNVAAFNDTLARLDNFGVPYIGAGKNLADASEVRIIEKNGIRVGFLGFTDVGPNWMKAEENKSGVLLASDPNRIEYIKKAKEASDVLVVSYHWGDEYVPFNARQKSLAESSIDAGADIVAGHHPHVIQDTVSYKNGLIMYSLGNFIFDQYFSEETMTGKLANVIVTKDGIKDFEEKIFKLDRTYVPGAPTKI